MKYIIAMLIVMIAVLIDIGSNLEAAWLTAGAVYVWFVHMYPAPE